MTVEAIFSPAHRLELMLAVEAALARALAREGVIDTATTDAIAAECDASKFDLAAIEGDALLAGNDLIPTVERLRVLVAKRDEKAASYVHWGATSQDIIDTALVLQLQDALAAFDEGIATLETSLDRLARDHARTPMAGRTWMQHAAPTTFGFKARTWLDGVTRSRARVCRVRDEARMLQFGGAVGNLGALGPHGPGVARALADELGLQLPDVSWHTTRDRLADVATTLALLTGSLGKIARDISLLAQSEIGELREPSSAGRGRSSTMPHKRNPVGCATVLAAAVRAPHLAATMLSAMIQEHERGLGSWQAEWQTLPELCVVAYDALWSLNTVVAGLEVNADRMLANIEATRGLIFAEAVSFGLVSRMGRSEAGETLKRAMKATEDNGTHLLAALLDDPAVRRHFSEAEVTRLFDVTGP